MSSPSSSSRAKGLFNRGSHATFLVFKAMLNSALYQTTFDFLNVHLKYIHSSHSHNNSKDLNILALRDGKKKYSFVPGELRQSQTQTQFSQYPYPGHGIAFDKMRLFQLEGISPCPGFAPNLSL